MQRPDMPKKYSYKADLNMIWIISLGGVPILSMIDDYQVIYPCLFAFNFSSNILVLLVSVL
jgi:hypothetical protein